MSVEVFPFWPHARLNTNLVATFCRVGEYRAKLTHTGTTGSHWLPRLPLFLFCWCARCVAYQLHTGQVYDIVSSLNTGTCQLLKDSLGSISPWYSLVPRPIPRFQCSKVGNVWVWGWGPGKSMLHTFAACQINSPSQLYPTNHSNVIPSTTSCTNTIMRVIWPQSFLILTTKNLPILCQLHFNPASWNRQEMFCSLIRWFPTII